MKTLLSTPAKADYLPALLKRFLLIYLPLLLIMIAIVSALYTTDQQVRRRTFGQQEILSINQQHKVIANDIRGITSDVQVLADYYLLHAAHNELAAVTDEFRIFALRKKIYDQIRFLDANGMEKIRINYQAGSPSIVPPEALQDKSRRYYFKDTISLGHNEIFVSPCDLNIEQGAIEQPLKPTIRFGAPVFAQDGSRLGIVLLNYLAQEILNDIKGLKGTAVDRIMLVNREGYWLKAPSPEDEWAFMFPEKKERSFALRFPLAWQKISANDSGQFIEAAGMFTYATIRPLNQGLLSSTGSAEAFAASRKRLRADEYSWKIISFVPAGELAQKLQPYKMGTLMVSLVLSLLLGLGCWIAAESRLKRTMAEVALKENEEKFRTVAEFTYDWESWLGPEGYYLYTSPSCERLTGFPAKEFYADPGLYLSLVHPEDRELFRSHLRDDIDSDRVCEMDFRIITRSGQVKWVAHNCRPVFSETGQHLGRRSSNRDVTQRAMAELRLKEMASHDTLTGLPNRNLLLDRLTQGLARAKRGNTRMAVLFLDLDHFKEINDSLGHNAGDQVLQTTAKRMSAQLREEDTVARMGGDEFVIIIQDLREGKEATAIAEKLLTAIREPISIAIEGADLKRVVGSSIGISIFPEDGADANTLLSKADSAMYQNKQAGRSKSTAARAEENGGPQAPSSQT
jgi:diguanylate cyclase (GGDEF)-like protein/PAS domain S-box-containing protein